MEIITYVLLGIGLGTILTLKMTENDELYFVLEDGSEYGLVEAVIAVRLAVMKAYKKQGIAATEEDLKNGTIMLLRESKIYIDNQETNKCKES